jgi:hypothetical protein
MTRMRSPCGPDPRPPREVGPSRGERPSGEIHASEGKHRLLGLMALVGRGETWGGPAAESTRRAPVRRGSGVSSRRGVAAAGRVQAATRIVYESIHSDSDWRTLSRGATDRLGSVAVSSDRPLCRRLPQRWAAALPDWRGCPPSWGRARGGRSCGQEQPALDGGHRA